MCSIQMELTHLRASNEAAVKVIRFITKSKKLEGQQEFSDPYLFQNM